MSHGYWNGFGRYMQLTSTSMQLAVPLIPPLGVERDRVVTELFDQLAKVIQLLRAVPALATPSAAPPVEATV